MGMNATQDPLNCVERRIEYKLGSHDPYFSTCYTQEYNGEAMLPQVIIRPIPEVINSHDRVIVEKLRKRAYKLEQSSTFMGMKVGSTAGIGLIPAIGPLWNLYDGLKLLKLADELEIPLGAEERSKLQSTLQKGFVLGLFPIIGDVFQAAFKGNTRNVMLIEQALARKCLNGIDFS